MMRTLTLALGAMLASACATVGPGAPADPAAGGTCRNAQLQPFVGQAATAELGARIIAASGARTLQWVAAGTMVTMEFRADRVRVYLDESNRVQRVSCG